MILPANLWSGCRFDCTPPAMGGGCHVYGDGSVTLTTGGLEMGQGLYTKIKQARPYDVILHLTCQAHADAPGMGKRSGFDVTLIGFE